METVTIYADVLIVLNIYVNFFLLRITARLTRTYLRTGRCAAASVFGSLFSLLILLPDMGTAAMTAIRLGTAMAVAAAAFGIGSPRRLAVNTGAFFGSSMLLAGAVQGACCWLRPDFVHTGNGFFYVDFSLLLLTAVTAALYLAVCAAERLTIRSSSGKWRVIIRHKGHMVSIEGLPDTGDLLTDYFTGSPVIICSTEEFEKLLGTEYAPGALPAGFRLLPCATVSSSGLIPVFRPDEVLIVNESTGERKAADAVVGFGNCGSKAVFNPELIKY
ncbi:MAG TPA: hypothetical protein DCZ71_07930 [Ruminococcus sp.]|nr:hypothetical protein [Ruminococcus sp.]